MMRARSSLESLFISFVYHRLLKRSSVKGPFEQDNPSSRKPLKRLAFIDLTTKSRGYILMTCSGAISCANGDGSLASVLGLRGPFDVSQRISGLDRHRTRLSKI